MDKGVIVKCGISDVNIGHILASNGIIGIRFFKGNTKITFATKKYEIYSK